MAFIDHGIPVQADESRSGAVCANAQGERRLVITARGYVLVVHPDTGDCRQLPFPEGLVDYPFASIGARDGLFYTGAGHLFMVLDPFEPAWRFHASPAPGESIMAFSLAEGPDGAIYASTYPHCHLFRYDPATQDFTGFGPMDETQEYVSHLAVDATGWVYLGIGTERKNLLAFHPAIGERRQLLPESARTRGAGHVHLGADGQVYGHWGEGWHRFEGGRGSALPESEVSPWLYTGHGYNRIHRSADLRLVRLSLPDRELVLGERTLALRYESQGAHLAPMVAGPDGNLYGTSMHPLQFYTYRPAEGRLVNYGGKAVERGGGGNICAYAVQGGMIAGAAYAGGFFHLFDPKSPVAPGNPRLAAIHDEIHRPRCALAHPDGRHIIWGGFAGYGAVGGALAIYDLATGTDEVLPNQAVVPDQSTLCLGALEGGDLMGGTSILAPGGAQPRASEAVLYRLDWATRKVRWRCTPIPGAREIALLAVEGGRRVHAITGDSCYFAFDPETREVLCRHDLSSCGEVVRDGLRPGPGGVLYALLRNAICRIDPESLRPAVIARPPVPITAGMAILQGRLYFGSGSHLWSYSLEQGARTQ